MGLQRATDTPHGDLDTCGWHLMNRCVLSLILDSVSQSGHGGFLCPREDLICQISVNLASLSWGTLSLLSSLFHNFSLLKALLDPGHFFFPFQKTFLVWSLKTFPPLMRRALSVLSVSKVSLGAAWSTLSSRSFFKVQFMRIIHLEQRSWLDSRLHTLLVHCTKQ